MINVFVFIQAERHSINNVIQNLLEIEGVSEVYSVTGNYDIIAILRVKTHEQISKIVTQDILNMQDIIKTDTHVAFKAYSKHDLEAMWAIGLEE